MEIIFSNADCDKSFRLRLVLKNAENLNDFSCVRNIRPVTYHIFM